LLSVTPKNSINDPLLVTYYIGLIGPVVTKLIMKSVTPGFGVYPKLNHWNR